jgi:hypothetical protein
MYVYLQAYEQGATGVQPLIAFVSLYAGQKKAFETQPIEVASGAGNRLNTMPIQFSIALANLPPGQIRLPGDGARPNRTEGGVLAGSYRAGSITEGTVR